MSPASTAGTRGGKEPRSGQVHLRTLNKAITAAGNRLSAEQQPLVETLRTLARQMDDAGRNPSTRLTTAYLQAQKELARRLESDKPASRGPNRLEQLRAEREERQAG